MTTKGRLPFTNNGSEHGRTPQRELHPGPQDEIEPDAYTQQSHVVAYVGAIIQCTVCMIREDDGQGCFGQKKDAERMGRMEAV